MLKKHARHWNKTTVAGQETYKLTIIFLKYQPFIKPLTFGTLLNTPLTNIDYFAQIYMIGAKLSSIYIKSKTMSILNSLHSAICMVNAQQVVVK